MTFPVTSACILSVFSCPSGDKCIGMVEDVDLAWFLTARVPFFPPHGHPRQQHTQVHFVDLGLVFAVWSLSTNKTQS